MDYYSLEYLGDELTARIKNSNWFPFDKGHLKNHATFGHMYGSVSQPVYRIHFSSAVAPYVEFLEEGTKPHDIPNAFGFGPDFGIGGRFDGKFHPGSTKHKGFISQKAVGFIVDYIASKYDGEVEATL